MNLYKFHWYLIKSNLIDFLLNFILLPFFLTKTDFICGTKGNYIENTNNYLEICLLRPNETFEPRNRQIKFNRWPFFCVFGHYETICHQDIRTWWKFYLFFSELQSTFVNHMNIETFCVFLIICLTFSWKSIRS